MIDRPSGTGKSFIGALLAKALHQDTNKTILVVCYTNHACKSSFSFGYLLIELRHGAPDNRSRRSHYPI